jgi:hypothetical protein
MTNRLLTLVSFTTLFLLSSNVRAVDLSDVQPIFDASCALSGCHRSVETPLLNPEDTMGAIVGIKSRTNLNYIEPVSRIPAT